MTFFFGFVSGVVAMWVLLGVVVGAWFMRALFEGFK